MHTQLDGTEGYEPGQQLDWGEMFKVGDKVDVAGTSNGKGFQGACATPMPCLRPHLMQRAVHLLGSAELLLACWHMLHVSS
jgi:hypothetical protein